MSMQLNGSRWTPARSWQSVMPGSGSPLRKDVFHQRTVKILTNAHIPLSAETTQAYCTFRQLDSHERFHYLDSTNLPMPQDTEQLAKEQETDPFCFKGPGKQRLGAFHNGNYHTMWSKLTQCMTLDCALDESTTMSTIFQELKQYKELHNASHLAFSTSTMGRSSVIKPLQLTEITLKNLQEFDNIEL